MFTVGWWWFGTFAILNIHASGHGEKEGARERDELFVLLGEKVFGHE
jgi:hypothetical protein